MLQLAAHARLGKDPELKQTSTGNEMAVSSAAVDVTQGEGDQQTIWPGLVAFGEVADTQARQRVKHTRCLDCRFDSPDGLRCNAGMTRTHRDLKMRLCIYHSTDPHRATPGLRRRESDTRLAGAYR